MARSTDRQASLVLDPQDDVETLARLRRLHARPMGQIVCEPPPAGGSAGLARSLLAALGKNADRDAHLGSHRMGLWDLVDSHLQGDGVQHLILLRAHTIPYTALRRLADHTAAIGAHLWLVVHREHPPTAVVQLLEGLAHTNASLSTLLAHRPRLDDVDPRTVPPGAGDQFPFLELVDDFLADRNEPPYDTITDSLADPERTMVDDVWDAAHAWTTDVLEDQIGGTYSGAADAIYLLARHADTASEAYVRIHAAAEAFRHAGLEADIQPIDKAFAFILVERRPLAFNEAVTRAAALADQTANLQLAALIAVALIHRDPYAIRETNRLGLAPDASVLLDPFNGASAIPTDVRRYLTTWRRHLKTVATRQDYPLFPGQSHGRLSRPAIRRRLDALDVPNALWEDSASLFPRRGTATDGRLLLHHLNPITLWPHHRWGSALPQPQNREIAGQAPSTAAQDG